MRIPLSQVTRWAHLHDASQELIWEAYHEGLFTALQHLQKVAHAPAARQAAAGPAAEARGAPGAEVGAIRKDAHGD